MNLWSLQKHQIAQISGLSEELDPKIAERLIDMGIDVGQHIKCVRQTVFNGPRVFEVGGSEFALENDIANAIYITPVE